MTVKSKITIKETKRWMGQPVCIVLKDGSYYVGYITEVKNGEVTMNGQKGLGKMNRASIQHANKVRVSGFFPGMTAPSFGGGWGADPFAINPAINPGVGGLQAGGNAPGNAGGGGFMSMVGKVWPGIKMGIGMVQTIMPLLKGFKI